MRREFLLAGLIGAVLAPAASAAIIFDDFNTSLGHFGYAPNFSSQSVGEAVPPSTPIGTNERVETDSPLEGAGHQKLVLVHDGLAVNMRIRHLSGGPPYNSANGGNPAANTTFVTSAGEDGFIGFYAKTSANNTGWTIGLNLDDSANNTAGMDMGVAKAIIADGEWHLYEWNLDDDNDWVVVPSIGGDGTIQAGQHSVDSIYIFTNQTGTANQVRDPLFIDFVAKSDSGSIAALVPEPSMLGVLGLFAIAGMRRRR
jgi:MYXO-CTERM domain-containing protein